MLRVAALQFAALPDSERNLTCCLQWIQQAARRGAKLIVLPEFANHTPVTSDTESARSVAATPDGPFLTALKDACREHQLHLVVGVSFLAELQVTSTALLFGPDGALLGRADRQVFSPSLAHCHAAGASSELVVQTDLGPVGLCVGRDAAVMDTVRSLALAGARLVCVPLGPDAGDDMSIHLSARAAENRIFVIAAAHRDARDEAGGQLGGSVVLAPDGQQLGQATDASDGLILSELNMQLAELKGRPDGTDVFAVRRPELYRPLLGKVSRDRAPELADDRAADRVAEDAEDTLQVALISGVDAGSIEAAIDSAAAFVRELAHEGAQLVVLPELFCFEAAKVDDPTAAADWFQPAARRLAEACADSATLVVTSLVERTQNGFAHVGVVINHAGVVARAGQLHVPARHPWAIAARRFELLPLPWGKVALLVGEDSIVPEATRVLSLLGAELLIAPLGADESALTLLRAAALENGLSVVAAMRSGPAGGSFAIDPASGAEPMLAGPEAPVLRVYVRCAAQRSSLIARPYRSAQVLASAPGSATRS